MPTDQRPVVSYGNTPIRYNQGGGNISIPWPDAPFTPNVIPEVQFGQVPTSFTPLQNYYQELAQNAPPETLMDPRVPLIRSLNGQRSMADAGRPLEATLPPAISGALTTGQQTVSPYRQDTGTTEKRSGTSPGTSSGSKKIDYGTPIERAAMPDVSRNLYGPESQARYVTNGGRSEMIGGYGGNSQLAQWGLAKFFGQGDPATMMQKNSLMRVQALRNSPEYQSIYQKALRETGNPQLAAGQTDALFGQQMDGFAGDFINSGNDVATQKRFDEGLTRLNADSMINPTVGTGPYQSNLPIWGTYSEGVSPNGQRTVVTPDGTVTEMPIGFNPSQLSTRLTGSPVTKDPNAMTEYQKQNLELSRQANEQRQISNANSYIGRLNTARNQAFRNGDTEAVKRLDAEIAAQRKTLNTLQGVPTEPEPSITNSNGGSNG